jgi:ubiquinone biosynthesis monooxygenase Coq7
MVLRWSMAMMGWEVAMACMEAVETEIGDGQVHLLLKMIGEMEARGEDMSKEIRHLVDTVRRIRD